jgi:hypothetical protein
MQLSTTSADSLNLQTLNTLLYSGEQFGMSLSPGERFNHL